MSSAFSRCRSQLQWWLIDLCGAKVLLFWEKSKKNRTKKRFFSLEVGDPKILFRIMNKERRGFLAGGTARARPVWWENISAN